MNLWGLAPGRPVFVDDAQPPAAIEPPSAKPVGYDAIIERMAAASGGKETIVVFEAAHPDTLGRPSKSVVDEMVRHPMMSTRHVKLSFPADRLQIDTNIGDYNILCVGGPKSNVLTRTVMEYELTRNQTEEDYYNRINRPCMTLPVYYVQNPNIVSTVTAAEDEQKMVARIVRDFPGPTNLGDGEIDQASLRTAFEGVLKGRKHVVPRRFLALRPSRTDPEAGQDYVPVELAASAQNPAHPNPEILDFVWITVMPNPYDRTLKSKAIFIAGCTPMGTAAFLDPEVINAVNDLLAQAETHSGRIVQCVLPVLATRLLREAGSRLAGRSLKARLYGKRRDTGSPIDNDQEWSKFTSELIAGLQQTPHLITESIVNINKLDAQQMLKALHYVPIGDSGSRNIYVLGCYEKQKTFATQQGRALTFVHALIKAGLTRTDTRMVVIGAGPSGLATAVAAAMCGIKVQLVEMKTEFLSHLDAPHRFIHPNAYDWPARTSELHRSELPFFDWTAATADKVTRAILEAYKARRCEVRERYGEDRIIEHAGKKVYRVVTEDSQHRVYFKPASVEGDIDDEDAEYVVGDVVVIATGFPQERAVYARLADPAPQRWALCKQGEGTRLTDIETLKPFVLSDGYWTNNDAAVNAVKSGNTPDDVRKYVVVSGQGDGALIDIMRLCIVDFNHEALIKKLCFAEESDDEDEIRKIRGRRDLYNKMGYAVRRVTESQEYITATTNRQREKYLEEALADHPVRELFHLLGLELDPDVRIINVSKERSPFVAQSAIAHRLLVWALYLNNRVEFISGEIKQIEVVEAPPRGLDRQSKELGRLKMYIERNLSQSPDEKAEPAGQRRDKVREPGNIVGLICHHGIDVSEHIRQIRFGPPETDNLPPSEDKQPKIDEDQIKLFQELISIVNLTSRPHPETIKFFLHSIRRYR